MNFDFSDSVFLVLIVVMQVLWYRERKDLYSRLMARDLTEFSAFKTEESKAKGPTKPEKVLVPL